MFKNIKLYVALLMFMFSFGVQARSLDVDTGRLITIEGEISENMLPLSKKLLALAGASQDPIYISIDSPGGGVLAGLQFSDAIKSARARGIAVKCFVPHLAMSMAFYIFTQCSERYVLPYSLLLFHPMSFSLDGSYNVRSLLDMARDGAELEHTLIKAMIRVMHIDPKVFMTHYRRQTVWTGQTLHHRVPKFLTIVTDFGAATFGEQTK